MEGLKCQFDVLGSFVLHENVGYRLSDAEIVHHHQCVEGHPQLVCFIRSVQLKNLAKLAVQLSMFCSLDEHHINVVVLSMEDLYDISGLHGVIL